nr:transposase (putative), gypsy type [Tanacetum cinerariifolium]
MALSRWLGCSVASIKGVPKDPFLKSSEFNAKHFATLVALPAPFHKYPKSFLCLVGISHYYTLDEDAYPEFLGDNDEGMDLLAFIRTADPTKVRVAERQGAEDEPRLLESTVGSVVSLLPIAPARASSELEASVDKLFDEGASRDGQDADVQPVDVIIDTIVEDVAPLQPRRHRKRKTDVADADGPSHPPKTLKEDYGALGGAFTADSSHHFDADIAEAEADSIVRSSAPTIATVTTMTATIDADATTTIALVAPSLFGVGLSSTGRTDSVLGGFSDVSGSDFLIGGIRTVVDPDSDLQKAELLKVKDGEIESLKAQLLLKEAEATEAIHLRAEREKNELSVKVTDLSASVKVWEQEVTDLDAQVTAVKLQNDNLVGLQEKVAAYEGFVSQLEKFQDEKLEEVNEKFDKLCVDFVDMALHLEEKFYPHLLNTISGHRWLLTYGMELAVVKCLNLTEYLLALGAAISKDVEKVRETLAESTEGTPQYGPERPRAYSDLTSKEKDRYNADIRATHILLQGLPKDIYTLINHYTDAKNIWDNVKMLLEGSELTKEDRESQLFVTAVKLNRGLRDSNYDQLYAYLKQHETHAKENKMMLERFSQPTVDPLALLSNVSNPQHYSPSSSASSSIQVPQPLANLSSPAEDLIENLTNTLALFTQSYRTFLPQTNNQLRTSSNARNQATVQDGRVVVQNVQGHIARNCTQPKQPQNSEYYKDKMLLMQAQENIVALDAERLLFLAGGQDNAFDDDVDEQPVQDLALNVDNVFQADDCDAFDSDVDEAPTAQTMFMANLSSADPVTDEAEPSYDSDILSEVPNHDHYQDAACEYHEEHVMHDSVQLDHVVDSQADYTTNSNMIPYDQYVKDNEVPVVHSDVSSVPNDDFMMIYNDMCESHAQSVSNPSRNTVVKNSLTAELATYKEHVELYEQRAKFELTER